MRRIFDWLFRPSYTVTIIRGRDHVKQVAVARGGSHVNQKNSVAGGDIIGGDLYEVEREDRDTSCPHCGGPI